MTPTPAPEGASAVTEETVTLTRSEIDSLLRAAYPFSTKEERDRGLVNVLSLRPPVPGAPEGARMLEERPERVQAAFEVFAGKTDTGPNATAMFEYTERLEASLATERAAREAAEKERDEHAAAFAVLDDSEQVLQARVSRLEAALGQARTSMRNARGAIESNQVEDKDVHRTLTDAMGRIDAVLRAVLARTGEPKDE
ncbi:hypothetical protein GGQ64_005369 [Rhizobium azooxidifex]|uniref:Uncharacterized protein n=1 Tax=Mycoplana azooxidifex TaxID=1636188 RepID=A0A7W6DCE0_9HYPH|nr:hypothetical protein [Mycoplana azooxidifex]MBB3980122.1 hypothetical protein [Mycoplana azooxidifex]